MRRNKESDLDARLAAAFTNAAGSRRAYAASQREKGMGGAYQTTRNQQPTMPLKPIRYEGRQLNGQIRYNTWQKPSLHQKTKVGGQQLSKHDKQQLYAAIDVALRNGHRCKFSYDIIPLYDECLELMKSRESFSDDEVFQFLPYLKSLVNTYKVKCDEHNIHGALDDLVCVLIMFSIFFDYVVVYPSPFFDIHHFTTLSLEDQKQVMIQVKEHQTEQQQQMLEMMAHEVKKVLVAFTRHALTSGGALIWQTGQEMFGTAIVINYAVTALATLHEALEAKHVTPIIRILESTVALMTLRCKDLLPENIIETKYVFKRYIQKQKGKTLNFLHELRVKGSLWPFDELYSELDRQTSELKDRHRASMMPKTLRVPLPTQPRRGSDANGSKPSPRPPTSSRRKSPNAASTEPTVAPSPNLPHHRSYGTLAGPLQSLIPEPNHHQGVGTVSRRSPTSPASSADYGRRTAKHAAGMESLTQGLATEDWVPGNRTSNLEAGLNILTQGGETQVAPRHAPRNPILDVLTAPNPGTKNNNSRRVVGTVTATTQRAGTGNTGGIVGKSKRIRKRAPKARSTPRNVGVAQSKGRRAKQSRSSSKTKAR